MRIASMPMYDLPEARKVLDALWIGFVSHLRRQGFKNIPASLVHDRPVASLWQDPHLLLSQCCGFDLVNRYASNLSCVATPEYGAPGCQGSEYASFVVVAEHITADDVLQMRGTVCVINGCESHSGMSSLRELIAPVSQQGRFFSTIKISGGHVQSLDLLRQGEADVCAIDCITHSLLAHYRPTALTGTRVLGLTNRVPAIPYVTQSRAGKDIIERLRTALLDIYADPKLTALRQAVYLKDIQILSDSAYEKIRHCQEFADSYGYFELCGQDNQRLFLAGEI